jgi:hypothetical protein
MLPFSYQTKAHLYAVRQIQTWERLPHAVPRAICGRLCEVDLEPLKAECVPGVVGIFKVGQSGDHERVFEMQINRLVALTHPLKPRSGL